VIRQPPLRSSSGHAGRLERAHQQAHHVDRRHRALPLHSLWPLVTLVPFALVIRYGVIAREEAYLERTFGEVYRRYRARVRRWL